MKIKYPSSQDGRIRPAVTSEVDRTVLIDRMMPKRWKCPHCDNKNETGIEADDILAENLKYIEQCTKCGYLHIWELKLTDDFKNKVIEQIIERGF